MNSNIFFVCFGQNNQYYLLVALPIQPTTRCQYNQTIIHPISYSSVSAPMSTILLNMYVLDPLVDNDTDSMWGNVVYAPCATVVTLVGHTLLLRTITLQTQRRHVFHHKISHQISTIPLLHMYSYEMLKITVCYQNILILRVYIIFITGNSSKWHHCTSYWLPLPHTNTSKYLTSKKCSKNGLKCQYKSYFTENNQYD